MTTKGGTKVTGRSLDNGLDRNAALIQALVPHCKPCALTPDDPPGAVDAALAGQAALKCSDFSHDGLPKH
jgi:hypothetical protein